MKVSTTLLYLFLAAHAFARVPAATSELRIDQLRLIGYLDGLSQFGRNEGGGVTRVGYTEAELAGREYAMSLMRAAGLSVRIDAAGNIFGERPGSVPGLMPLMMGSHIDSVPAGGNYDGDVGSMAAIEVAQTLRDHNRALRHPLQVVIFSNEEGRCIGSTAITSGIPRENLGMITNVSGIPIYEGMKRIGGDPTKLSEARLQPGSIAAYLELHIEQGGILEAEKVQIGVVEGIVGINQTEVVIEGVANHAGTTAMNQRHDALLAAAKLIIAVNELATENPGRQVGTVGQISVKPGASNVVPGTAVLSVEFRDLDAEKIATLMTGAKARGEAIAAATGTRVSYRNPQILKPYIIDSRVRAAVDKAAEGLGYSRKQMPSGAGHDAQKIGLVAPAGMIFIPSAGGISHSPNEYTPPDDIGRGANVLLHALLDLDQEEFVSEAQQSGGKNQR